MNYKYSFNQFYRFIKEWILVNKIEFKFYNVRQIVYIYKIIIVIWCFFGIPMF